MPVTVHLHVRHLCQDSTLIYFNFFQFFFPKSKLLNSGCSVSASAAYMPVLTVACHLSIKLNLIQIISNIAFWGEGNPEYPGKTSQGRVVSYQTQPPWHWVWESNTGYIGERWMLSRNYYKLRCQKKIWLQPYICARFVERIQCQSICVSLLPHQEKNNNHDKLKCVPAFPKTMENKIFLHYDLNVHWGTKLREFWNGPWAT